MSKLNKSLQDYFQIPILLRAVGDTSQQTLLRFEKKLNQHFSRVELEEQDCAELAESMKDFLKSRRDTHSMRLKFMAKDFNSDWPQFEAIYRCHIVIAIYEGNQNDPTKLKENIVRLNKQMQDERRKLVSLLVMNLEKEKSYELDIEKYFMFLPEVPDQDLAIFLEPAIQEITKESMIFFAEEIRKLRSEDNDYIVFNKNEERPQPRHLRKKKRGRCLKLAGDYCLVLLADEDALSFYKQSMSALKSIDDYHWMMGVEQGRAAANLLKCIQIPRIIGEEENCEQYIKNLNEFMNNAIQLARKAKVPMFESECYFKILNSHRDIGSKSGVDQWAGLFVGQPLKNYVLEEQVIFLSEIALIFESLGMLRKRNYYMCYAATISAERKSDVSRMLLSYVKDNSPSVLQWEELYMLLLKELKRCDTNDQYRGVLECTILSNCRRKLSLLEVGELVQSLNYNLLDNIDLAVNLLQLKKVVIEESPKKPKDNRIGKPQKDAGVTAPWRRLINYKYQVNEPIKFIAAMENPLPVPLNIKYKLDSQPPNQSAYSSVYLEAMKTTTFPVELRLAALDHYKVQGLTVQLWHFRFIVPIPKQIRLEIYDESSDYAIDCPQQLLVERSSELGFKFELRNLNKVASSKLKINVSVYYTVETGLQQNIFVFSDEQKPSADTITVQCKESRLKACTTSYQSPSHIIMELEQLRVHRSLLKKIEIGIDYIQNDASKYQISDLKVVPVSFRDSIICQAIKATELTHQTCRNYYEGKRVVASQFFVFLKVSKHPDDLKAYSMQMYYREHKLDEFILSERVEMIRQLKLKKIHSKKDTDLDKVWEHLIKVKWECITNPEQKGEFFAEVVPEIRKTVLIASNKDISMWFHLNGKKHETGELHIPRYSSLTVHYKIYDETEADCSHEVVLHSRGVKERNIGYAIEGKTKLRGRHHLSNHLDIEFEHNYSTCFIVGLHFAEEIYLSEVQLHCGQ